ncbi:hypothetical protein [Dyella lipolytica]|uniref:Plastocyanin n=1 Tax=Dyella lipolytica TaxID=1867835 RepID=A0ABW8IVV5_9GAMM|nr:hypothetical protein [Dyella lipolytica]
MSLSRILVLAVIAVTGLATTQVAQAADASAFQVLMNDSGGNPVVFQSVSALKRGDVIKVHAFNARPVMIMQVAMCNSDCPRMHLVKTISLLPYYAGTANANQDFVVPEDGYVSFWVEQRGGAASVPIRAQTGTWSLNFVNRFMSFATPELFKESQPMSANAVSLDDNTLRVRYFHHTFVAVSLADAPI